MTETMREKNSIIICAMVCITLIICGIIFWPTLQRYGKIKYKEIERITKPMPIEEKSKMTGVGESYGRGQYKFIVFNGTTWTVKTIRLSIEAKDGQGNAMWQKTYEASFDIAPFSSGSSFIELIDHIQQVNVTDLSQYYTEVLLALVEKTGSAPFRKPGEFLGPLGFNPEVKIQEVFGYKGE